MSGTGNRTLRLLSLLQQRRHWPGGELATRLDVSLRTLRRDVERLRELGYPVDAQPGVDGGYRLAPGASLPPLVLDDDEAVALTVGLQAAAQSAVTGMAEASVRALTTVVQVLPARLRRRAETLGAMTVPAPGGASGPAVDPQVLVAVAAACRDTERLEFSYTAADGARPERLTEPFRLVALGRRWYLVAYDLGRGDWRSFRLDRLTAPTGTGQRFAPRVLPAEDAAAFVRNGTDARAGAQVVEALVEAGPDDVRRRVGPWATVTAQAGGRSLLRMETYDLSWAALALGSVQAEFTVLSPPALRDLLGDWAGRFDRAAGAGPPGAPASAVTASPVADVPSQS